MNIEQVGRGLVVAMILAQAALIAFGAGFWMLATPPALVAAIAAFSTFDYPQAAIAKPLPAFLTVAVLAVATAAFFGFAPEQMSFKLQMVRAVTLDVTLISFTCVAAAHARCRVKPG